MSYYALHTLCNDNHARKRPKLFNEINERYLTISERSNQEMNCYPQLKLHSNSGFNLHIIKSLTILTEFILWIVDTGQPDKSNCPLWFEEKFAVD